MIQTSGPYPTSPPPKTNSTPFVDFGQTNTPYHSITLTPSLLHPLPNPSSPPTFTLSTLNPSPYPSKHIPPNTYLQIYPTATIYQSQVVIPFPAKTESNGWEPLEAIQGLTTKWEMLSVSPQSIKMKKKREEGVS